MNLQPQHLVHLKTSAITQEILSERGYYTITNDGGLRHNIQFEHIPQELKTLRQWVVWKREKGTKVPYNVRTSGKAMSNNPETWSTFDRVCTAVTEGQFDGFGFMFSADGPYVGGDLDDCIRADGTIAQVAWDIITDMNTYSEI